MVHRTAHCSTLSCPHSCTDNTILHKNLTNALIYVNTTLLHWNTPTCFSPQGAINREYWCISWARSTEYVSRCKYQFKEQHIICSVFWWSFLSEKSLSRYLWCVILTRQKGAHSATITWNFLSVAAFLRKASTNADFPRVMIISFEWICCLACWAMLSEL